MHHRRAVRAPGKRAREISAHVARHASPAIHCTELAAHPCLVHERLECVRVHRWALRSRPMLAICSRRPKVGDGRVFTDGLESKHLTRMRVAQLSCVLLHCAVQRQHILARGVWPFPVQYIRSCRRRYRRWPTRRYGYRRCGCGDWSQLATREDGVGSRKPRGQHGRRRT